MKTEEDIYILEAVGAIICQRRKESKSSLRDIEKLCGLNNSKLAKIEKGQVNVTLTTFLQICKGLDISPSLLMAGYDPNVTIENNKRKETRKRKKES